MPHVYGNKPETILYKAPNGRKSTNHVLLGTWLDIINSNNDWYEVQTAGRGPGGWVRKTDVSTTPSFKAFFADVGQGDGAIIESPNGRMLIDGGPSKGFHSFMRYLYAPTISREGSVHFDAVVVSHPDSDHFNGLTRVLRDRRFTFGTIYHNGILRYYGNTPEGSEFDLGNITTDAQGQSYLTDTVSTLRQVEDRINTGSLMAQFKNFWLAALQAKQQGRLRSSRRLTSRDDFVPGFEPLSGQLRLVAKVLGPLPTKPYGAIRYVTFPDPHDHPSKAPSSSHTRNGHSVILRLEFGTHSFLFGGDLNIPAQQHLLNHYGSSHPFESDVAKACHHGSSDFDVSYIKKVNPHVNVFSSGDNKSFDHPMADALGAIGKHTRGDYPLLFSTEIARANSSSRIHYGLINARSNGTVLTMAQMKEQHNKTDVWDSYTVPWSGRFSGH